MRRWFATYLLIALLWSSGCGSGQRSAIEKVVPVSGVLTYRGTPLEFHQVTFAPEDGRRPAAGITDAAGRFTLGTNAPNDGAPPGRCKVAVVWVGRPQESNPGNEVMIDPAKLPKPKIKIPTKYFSADTSELIQDVPNSGLSDLKLDLQ